MQRFTAFALLAAVSALTLVGCAPGASSACDASMTQAADAGIENDSQMIATLRACDGVDDWTLALQAHPEAGSLISYTEADAHTFLALVCMRDPDADICAEASERGLLDYELDDPALDDLS